MHESLSKNVVDVVERGVDNTGERYVADEISALIRNDPPWTTFHFPVGRYRLDKAVVAGQSNIVLEGDHPAPDDWPIFFFDRGGSEGDDRSGLLVAGSESQPISGIRIRHLRIDGGRVLPFGILVAHTASDVRVSDCRIRRCFHAGIRLAGNGSHGATLRRVVLDRNAIWDIGNEGGIRGQGMELFSCSDVEVRYNRIWQCTGWGIRPIGAKDSQIEENTVEACAIGVSVQPDGSGGLPPSPGPDSAWRITRNLTISKNEFTLNSDSCIDFHDGCENVSVMGNVFVLSVDARVAISVGKAGGQGGPVRERWPLSGLSIRDNEVKVF